MNAPVKPARPGPPPLDKAKLAEKIRQAASDAQAQADEMAVDAAAAKGSGEGDDA